MLNTSVQMADSRLQPFTYSVPSIVMAHTILYTCVCQLVKVKLVSTTADFLEGKW